MEAIDHMEVVDWDGSTITLYGLDTAMSPAKVREAVTKELVSAATELKVQGQLKDIAVCLHNHQKATPLFRDKVSLHHEWNSRVQ